MRTTVIIIIFFTSVFGIKQNHEEIKKNRKNNTEEDETESTEIDLTPLDIDISERIVNPRSDLEPRIVGGLPADPGMFSFQVAIFVYIDNSSRYYFCGGVFIHCNFVLTAAHCCAPGNRFHIILGATNFRVTEPSQIRVNTTEKIIHGGWNKTTMEHDICLLRLPVSVNSTDFIKTIPIWNKSKNETMNQYATISGWGRISDNNMKVSNNLQYICVPVIPICGICQSTYVYVYYLQICTSSEDGMSPCNGDSGGPMIITDSCGTDKLVGIISYGHVRGCQRGYPAVQTYVPYYYPWILSVINFYENGTAFDNKYVDNCTCCDKCI